jgi:hypothetical protein
VLRNDVNKKKMERCMKKKKGKYKERREEKRKR